MKYFLTWIFVLILSLVSAAYFGEAQSKEITKYVPREIYLHGEVNEAAALQIGDEIKKLNSVNHKEIVLHITSPGGDVYSGLQIIDYMSQSKAPIRTFCEGYCMSMGAYILSSGNMRQASAHATIMFHQVSTSAQGNLSQIKYDLAEAQRLQDTINEILTRRTFMSKEDLQKMESYDHFMSPSEALKLNMIDLIVGQ